LLLVFFLLLFLPLVSLSLVIVHFMKRGWCKFNIQMRMVIGWHHLEKIVWFRASKTQTMIGVYFWWTTIIWSHESEHNL
jgi:hypothetical protein